MLYYVVAAGVFAHAFFWGAGLAWLVVPRPWKRLAWLVAPALGIALQSTVVWLFAHGVENGFAPYAWWSELLPAVMLLAAFSRGAGRGLPAWRSCVGVVALALAVGWMLLSPMARASRGLTASSLGSADHADIVAGARLLQEFGPAARVGLLDQPEVTEVLDVVSLYDHRLKLAPFIPSALIAHNAAVFGVEPRRLVSITGVAFVLCGLPLAWAMARAVLGLRRGLGWAVAAIAGLSPLASYAVHHGAMAGLVAALGAPLAAIGLVGAGRAAFGGRSAWQWLPLVLAGSWLVGGGRVTLLPWVWVPGVAWLLGEGLRRAHLAAALRVLVMLIVCAELFAVVYWDRLDGLLRRWGATDAVFGWEMSLVAPDAWLGAVADVELHAWPPGARAVVSGLVGLTLVVGLWSAWRAGRGWTAFALLTSGIAGWWWTATRSEHALREYAAWEFALAHAGMLIACWLALLVAAGGAGRRKVAWGCLILVIAVSILGADRFRRRMGNPPLRVDRTLAEVATLEADPRISSINLRIQDPWARLWASAFLLRHHQYFPVHEYEARRATALRGEWDLSDSLVHARPLGDDNFIAVNDRFHAVRVAAPGSLDISFSPQGWYLEEGAGEQRWRWSDGSAHLLVRNPALRPQRARLEFRVRLPRAGRLSIHLASREVWSGDLDETVAVVEVPAIEFAPGDSQLELRLDGEPFSPPGDSRRLAVALYAGAVIAVP